MTGRRSEIEHCDDRLRQASELADRCADIVAFHNTSFIERYLRGDGYAAIRLVGGGATQFGFLIKADRMGDAMTYAEGKAGEIYPSWHNEGPEQTAVFPGEVQIMEGAKQIVPSRVWLELFDFSSVDVGKPLYLFEDGVCLPACGSQEIVLALPDGKISASGLRVSIAGGQDTGKKVKTATDAVNDCSRFGLDHGIDGLKIREAVDFFSGLRIGIYSDGVGLTSLPFDDAFHQLYVLGHGPTNGRLCF